MQIVCPHCATSYDVNAASLGERGRMVRCAHCKETWFAEPPHLVSADSSAPSMWQEEEQAGGWTVRDGAEHAVVPEDRFAGQQSDVEFAVPDDTPEVDDAPQIAPEPDADATAETIDGAPAGAVATAEEPDYFEVRRRRGVKKAKKPQKKFVTKPRLIALCAVIIVGLLVGRDSIARVMPQTASLYAYLGMPVNLRGLAFESVRGTLEQQEDGASVLVIEGTIRNLTRDPMEVPRLRFAMRNASGAEIYSWTALPERAVLPAGESQPFRTRLASPPGDSRQVYVRFFQRRDVAATNQTPGHR